MRKSNILIYLVLSLGMFMSCSSCQKQEPVAFKTRPVDSIPTDTQTPENIQFYFGADLSSINMVEDYNGTYKNEGATVDPFLLFQQKGCHVSRVRLFHTPENPAGYNQWNVPGTKYCGLADVTKTIRRSKEAGMQVSLDFHYSDEWADPAKQYTPLAWQGLALDVLKDSVYNYTLAVMQHLGALDLTPEFVQIGNEIDPGLLHPVGKDMAAMGVLLNSGIKAVRDFAAGSTIKPKIIIHFSDNSKAVSRAQRLADNGVTDYDILGLSYYDEWGKTPFEGLTQVLKDFKAQFNKEIMVVETSYRWTETNVFGYPDPQVIYNPGFTATKDGQLAYLKALTQHVIDGGGTGLMYWEPAWIPSGIDNDWDTQALFDFEGNALPGLGYMSETYVFPTAK